MGGLLNKAPEVNGHKITGGPQMFQLSLDGRRLYVTTSLFSTWDNQFYPEIRENGGCMIRINCDTENGGMEIDPDFFVDFGKEPHGPAAATRRAIPAATAPRTSGCRTGSIAILSGKHDHTHHHPRQPRQTPPYQWIGAGPCWTASANRARTCRMDASTAAVSPARRSSSKARSISVPRSR